MWGRKQIAGVVYDRTHLDPFIMDVTPKAQGAVTYKVRVSFGCHTFTRELLDGDTPDLHFHDGEERRCFCVNRHRFSGSITQHDSRYAANGRVYFSERANFLVVENVDGANAPYVAFFKIEKATKIDGYDAAMFVTSAHLKPALPSKLPAVTFSTVVDYTVRNKQLTRPEPRKIVPVKRK